MNPVTPPARCRLCGASSYRRVTHRGADGSITYSGLYCCNGCSVSFADPAAWREASQVAEVNTGAEEAAAAAPEVTPPARKWVPDMAIGWGGGTPLRPRDPLAYGERPEDLKAIREAAARANKSKGRRGGGEII